MKFIEKNSKIHLNTPSMNTFKKKRVYKTLTIEEVARNINVSPQVISDLENANSDSNTYPFIYYCAKSYAEYLEIDLPKNFLRHKPKKINL